MTKIEYDRTIVVIGGLGSVASCAVPLINREFKFARMVVLDARDQTEETRKKKPMPEGVEFYVEKFTGENYKDILAKYLKNPGDICCNLSVIDSRDMLIWCMDNDCLYMDTSAESWAEDNDDEPSVHNRANFSDASLSRLHRKLANSLSELYTQNPDKKEWPTCVVQHGMNPGLVNQFIKQGLHDIATELLQRAEGCRNRDNIQNYLAQKDWAHLSQALGVQTIHISERDTQRSTQPRAPGEFHSTWSVPAFIVELRDYSEIGLGTFEKRIPRDAYVFNGKGDTSAIMGGKAANMRCMSWVPSGPIQGYPCPHDEAITMARFLEVRNNQDDSLLYRPTVMFTYMPCDASLASIHEFAMTGYKDATKPVLLTDDTIVDGMDEVGVLLMGHELGAWWTGSRLDIHRAKSILAGHNATTMQVAAGVVGALAWMVQNPKEGFNFPEHTDHEVVIGAAKKYMEPFVSIQSDWTPLKDRTDLSLYDYNDRFGPIENGPNAPCIPKKEHEWQLATMLLHPAGNQWVPNPVHVPTSNCGSKSDVILTPADMIEEEKKEESALATKVPSSLLRPWQKNALRVLPLNDPENDPSFDVTLCQEIPDGIRIGRTAYGWGLFAEKPFKRGEVLYQGHGITIPNKLDARFKLGLNQGMWYELDAQTHSCRKSETDERWLYGFDGFYNHSCSPNTYSANCEEDQWNVSSPRFFTLWFEQQGGYNLTHFFFLPIIFFAQATYLTVANKDIQPGDELTCDYNLFEWDCEDKGIEKCLCGSPDCLGAVRGFKFLPLKTQMEKLGNLSCKAALQAWLEENPKTVYHMIKELPSGLRISQSEIHDGHAGLQATKDFKAGETFFENQAIFIPQAPLDRASERDTLIISYPDPTWERRTIDDNKSYWLVENHILSASDGKQYFTQPPLVTNSYDWHYHTEIRDRTPDHWTHEFFSFDTFCNHGCTPSAEMVYDEDASAPTRNSPNIVTLLGNGKVQYNDVVYDDLASLPEKIIDNILLIGAKASRVKGTEGYRMVACHDVKAGQEITCDYSKLLSNETCYIIEECKCGSAQCRGRVIC